MSATVQRNMKFLGKQRKFGDVLSDEEMASVTPQMRNALISGGHIKVEGASGPGMGDEASQRIMARLDSIDDRLKKLEQRKKPGRKPKAKVQENSQ